MNGRTPASCGKWGGARCFAYGSLASGIFVVTALPAAHAADETASVAEVVVTGSRIRQQTGMTTPVPVTTVSLTDLSALNPSASIADQLDKLPQLFQTESAQRSSGALFGNAGGTYLNLRGLESKRTLVLLDGSRVVEDDRGGTVNVGVFPIGLIKSVDIITGGASAQYGADAVGGVVNFVLDRTFEGLKATASAGITERGDGFSRKLGIAAGTKIGAKLHVTASLDYNRIDQIQRDPTQLGDWFQRWGFVTNPAWKSATLTPGVPQRLTLPHVISSTHSPFGRIDTAYSTLAPRSGLGVKTVPNFTYLNNVFTQNDTGVRPFVPGSPTTGAGGTQSMAGGPEYDAANTAFAGGPYGAEVREPNAFLALRYDVTDHLRLIAQALYGQSESNQLHQRGQPHLQDIWFATIYSGNPYLPAAVQQAMTQQGVVAFKMLKLGQIPGLQNWADDQTDHNVHTMFTWNIGAEADLWSDWQARINWQTGRSHKFTEVLGDLRVDREFLALDAVTGPNGAPICRVQLFNPTPAQLAAAVPPGTLNKYGTQVLSPVGLDNTISGCVPLNPFGQGNVSDAARKYLTAAKWGISDVHQHFGEAMLTGKLFDGWAGPVSTAFGVTYRKEELQQAPYPVDVELLGPPLNAPSLGIRGIPGGFTGGSPNLIQFSTVPPIQGSYNVKEVFAELQLPLFKTSTGQRLDSDYAVRESRYSSSGTVEAYKFGLNFDVYRDLRLRATLSRDVREATFAERFDSQGSGGSVYDPAPVGLNSATNQSFQITSVAVGNPDLRPERADTITLGAIFRPSFRGLDGLQLSADYYSVRVKDAIGQLGLQNIVSYCWTGQTVLCQYVQRDPLSNTLTRVFNPYLNIAQVKVRGIDFEAQYLAHPTLLRNVPQTLTLRGFAARLLERTNIPTPGSREVRLDGGFDPSGANGAVLYPTWKGNLSAAYTAGPWTAEVLEEWIGVSAINTTWIDGVDVDNNFLPNYFNTNLKLAYDGDFKDHPWQLALFVTNLLNRDPMRIPSYNSRAGSQTVSDNYDAYGRSYTLSLNFRW